VLFNLLDNAYKYSNGSRKIDLKLLVFHPGLDPGLEDRGPKTEDRNETKDLRLKNEVCLSVRDYGIGISERDLGRIFERFYRGDRLRTEGIKGSGIGLTIVNRIVQAHGGRIEVESEIDKGTTVSVYLPIKSKES
jgi:signal transduction histidine kinase